MLDNFIFVFTQKLAVLFIASLSVVGGFLATSVGPGGSAAQTAIIANASGTFSPATLTIAVSTVNLPDIPPNLLPTSTVPFCTASSTCGVKAIKILIKKSVVKTVTTASLKKPVPPPTAIPKTAAVSLAAPSLTSTTKLPLQSVTAQGLINSAKLSFQETRTGPYEAVVNATGPNGENISWNIGAQTVGGTGGIPQFTNAFSCDPAAGIPAIDAPDQNPFFNVSTAYSCTISLTPLTGNNLVTQSNNFLFTTTAGDLLVTRVATMDTVLTNDANDGGIVFDNQDASPVTITGLTFDASYTALNTTNGPLVFRLLDPVTNQDIFDTHLETAPPDPTIPYTNAQTGITVSSSFTIPGMSQKMLPIQILGVDKMLMPGINPTVTITLRSITTNRSDMKIDMSSPQISWSCVVALGGYDPNATSGAFASGQVCRN